MDSDLVLLSRKAAEDIALALKHMKRAGNPRARKEHPWVFTPGQPVPVTNNATTLAPKGGFAWCNGSSGSDSEHIGIVQPQWPGIAATLLIIDDDIPPGVDGLAWPMDGCEHPVLFAATSEEVAQRIGAQTGSWTGMLNPIGPVTITQAADSTGLALARLHGQRGDHKMCDCGESGPSGPYQVILLGPGHTITEDSPGNLTMETV